MKMSSKKSKDMVRGLLVAGLLVIVNSASAQSTMQDLETYWNTNVKLAAMGLISGIGVVIIFYYLIPAVTKMNSGNQEAKQGVLAWVGGLILWIVGSYVMYNMM